MGTVNYTAHTVKPILGARVILERLVVPHSKKTLLKNINSA